MSGSLNNSGPHHDPSGEPSRDGQEPKAASGRIPPPAFPPGRRRIQMRGKLVEEAEGERAGGDPDDMEGAFISPDDPMPERTGFEGAFISPDDPMPERASGAQEGIEGSPSVQTGVSAEEMDEEAVVTGMGDDAHMDPRELAYGGDPYVSELVEAVKKLAAGLDHRGEAGLRSAPEMTRFETQLRAYCVGFLAGRRAEDEEG